MSAGNSLSSAPRPPRPRAGPDGALFIEALDPSRSLATASSCLEFLLLSFCQHFGLKPKQAAGLLTQGGKYLAHIIAKGLRGKYEPVVAWYQAVYSNEKQLMIVVMKEEASGSVNLILSTLRPGFFSKNFETAQWTCRLFARLGADFLERDMLPAAWDVRFMQWFASEGGGIDACITTCKRFGPDIKASAVSVLVQFGQNTFLELFTIQLRNLLFESINYLTTINEFLPNLCEIRASKQELIAAGIVDFWIEFALKEADADSRKPVDVRLAAIALLCDIWVKFPSKIEGKEELANNMLTSMKRASRDKSRILRFAVIGRLFNLLDQFSLDRNAYAPIVYKTLTFSLVENYPQESIRDFMLANFIATFKQSPSIPIGILLDPLLKQMQVSDSSQCAMSDFDFFHTVAKHPRLNLKNAIQVLDLLGKLYLSSPGYGRAAGVPFVIISTRFIDTKPLQEYLFRFCKYSLKLVVEIERSRRGPKKPPKYIGNALMMAGLGDELPEEVLNGQKRIMIYDMISRIIALYHPTLNEQIKQELLMALALLKRETGAHSKGILTVLSLLGESAALLEEAAEAEQRLAEEEKAAAPAEVPLEPRSPRLHQRSIDSLPGKKSQSSSKVPRRRVLIDIEKAKLKREEREMKELLQIELKRKDDENKRRQLKRQFQQQKIKAGRVSTSDRLVLPEGGADSRPEEHFYYDLSEELPEDQDGVNLIMRKYSRVLKFLYKKYSSTGYRRKENKTFDLMAENLALISEPEFYKMLKDQGVTSVMATKEASTAIFKHYCIKTKRTDNTTVDYEGYLGVIIQVALYIFSKPPKDLSVYPPAVSVRALFDLFRSASSERGVSIKFYDEPDPGAGDKDIVKKLNQVLIKDPNAPLPEGYRKVIDKELEVRYAIPPTVALTEASKTSLGVLDDLLNSLFGVHILEPQFVFVGVPRARGVLLAPGLTNSFTGSQQSNSQFSASPIIQAKPVFNIDPEIKYQVTILGGRYPPDHVLECARTLEDLIYSVEQHSTTLISRNRKVVGQIQNKVKLMKDMKEKEEELQKKRAEHRRKLRQQVVEEKLKKEKEEKEAKEREENEKKKEEQRIRIERLRKREEDHKKEREEKEKLLKEWNQKRSEETSLKVTSEVQKKQEEEERKKKLREEFLNKERKRISELVRDKQQQRQTSIERNQQESLRKTQLRKTQKQKLLEKIQQDKAKRDEEHAQRGQVIGLMTQPEFSKVFEDHHKSLEALFVHYCKMAIRPDQDPALAKTALQFAGYNKFLKQFEVDGNLLSTESSLQIFRQLTKERPATATVIALSLEEFKQALMNMAVAAHPKLLEIGGNPPHTPFNATSLMDFLGYLMITPDVKKTTRLLQEVTNQAQKADISEAPPGPAPPGSRSHSLKRIRPSPQIKPKPGSSKQHQLPALNA